MQTCAQDLEVFFKEQGLEFYEKEMDLYANDVSFMAHNRDF